MLQWPVPGEASLRQDDFFASSAPDSEPPEGSCSAVAGRPGVSPNPKPSHFPCFPFPEMTFLPHGPLMQKSKRHCDPELLAQSVPTWLLLCLHWKQLSGVDGWPSLCPPLESLCIQLGRKAANLKGKALRRQAQAEGKLPEWHAAEQRRRAPSTALQF